MPRPTPLPVTIRPAKPTDLPFVLSAFARSLKPARVAESTSPQQLHLTARAVVARLFEEGGVRIASPEGAPDVVAAFLLSRGDMLIWAYTKSGYRQAGLASALLKDAFAPSGLPARFCLYHGGFAQRLRRRGADYTPLALSELGEPQEATMNALREL